MLSQKQLPPKSLQCHLIHATFGTHPNHRTRSRCLSQIKIRTSFQLSVMHAHDKIHRNVPHLRHSWCRIDFVAIISFWISFGLASGGLERAIHHIGIFRVTSVLRTARLLTLTSGTTVGAFYLIFRHPRIPIPSSIRPLCTRSRLHVLSLLASRCHRFHRPIQLSSLPTRPSLRTRKRLS
jgi:hypothetical protein